MASFGKKDQGRIDEMSMNVTVKAVGATKGTAKAGTCGALSAFAL